MGHYTVWVLPGDRQAMQELLDRYDEANDTPGEWPGLSFDYCEPIGETSGAELYRTLRDDPAKAPFALVSPRGQIRLAPRLLGANDAVEDGQAPALTGYGVEEMLNELGQHQDSVAFIMDWHS